MSFEGGVAGSGTSVVGYQFTTGATTLTIYGLGAFDHGGDGFSGPAQVQLRTMGGTVLADLNVTGTETLYGAGGFPANSGFRYATLSTPLVLAANTSYILAVDPQDIEGNYLLSTAYQGGSGVTIDNPMAGPSFGGLTIQSGFAYGVFGPNLAFSPLVTPMAAYWTGDQGSGWYDFTADDSNWATTVAGTTDTNAGPGATTDVYFSANGATNQSTTLDYDATIKSLTIQTSDAVTINSGTGGPRTLTLDWSDGTGIDVQPGAGLLTIGANVAFAGGSNTIAVANTAGVLINGIVSGEDGLVKEGTGQLTLAGNNTYTGGTTISAGTLSIGNGGATGSIIGDVVNDGALIFNRSTDSTYAGIVSGTGTLTKRGEGNLTLSGANIFTGDTSIARGMLEIAGSTARLNMGTTGNLDVATDAYSASLLISGGAKVTSAAGSIGKAANGSATVTGTGSVWETGTLKVGEVGTGFLQIYTGARVKAADISLGLGGEGEILVNGANARLVSDSIAVGNQSEGTLKAQFGAVIKTGHIDLGSATATGTLDLENSTLEAAYVEKKGDVVVSLFDSTIRATESRATNYFVGFAPGDVSIGGRLTFNTNGFDVTLANSFAGGGGITKTGGGTLTLSAANTFTDYLEVLRGRLILNHNNAVGNHASDLAVIATGSNATVQVNSGITVSKGFAIRDGATLDNRGTINSTDGIWSTGAEGARILNTGDITVSNAIGIDIRNGAGTVNNNGGTITSNTATAILLRQGGTVKNRNGGEISGSTSQAGVVLNTSGTVENLGGSTITGNGVTAVLFYAGGALVNRGGSTITATGSDTDGVYVQGAAAAIDNLGTSSISGSGNGVMMSEGGTLYNEGTITGQDSGVTIYGASSTFTNKGKVDGDVYVYSTAQLLKLYTGSEIIGSLSSYSADAELELRGGGGPQFLSDIVNGGITFSGIIRKYGNTTWTFDRDIVDATSTDIIAGKVLVNNQLGGNVTARTGTTLGGAGSVGGTVTVENGASLNPGEDGVGTFSVGGLTLDPTSVLNFDLGSSLDPYDRVLVDNELTLDGLLNIQATSEFGPGVYSLFTYGTLVDNGLVIDDAPGAYDYSLLDTGSEVRLVVDAATAQYWNGSNNTAVPGSPTGGDGVWNNTRTNWTNATGTGTLAWTGTLPAIFGGTAGTVRVTDTVSVSEIRFITDGYLLRGNGELAIDGSRLRIHTDQGVRAEIRTEISGSGQLVKNGRGSLLLSRGNSYTGGTLLRNGTLRIGHRDALGTGTLTINGGRIANGSSNEYNYFENDVVANGDFTVWTQGVISGLDLEGDLDLGTAATRTISFEGRGLTGFGGVISGQALTLTALGNLAMVEFYGSESNTFTGLLTLEEGVQLLLSKDSGAVAVAGDIQIDENAALGLFGNGQIATTSDVWVDGVLDLFFATDVEINGLYGSGEVLGGLFGSTLTVQEGEFSGFMVGGFGPLSLVKEGAGMLTLYTANGYTGGTQINAGTVRTFDSSALGGFEVELNGGTLYPAGADPLRIGSLDWNGGTITRVLDASTDASLILDDELTVGADGGVFDFFFGPDFQIGRVYDLLSAYNLDDSMRSLFSGTAYYSLLPIFDLDGDTLTVTYIGSVVLSGPLLQNSAPVGIPTFADFLVDGRASTGTPEQDNTINSLIFNPGSALRVFQTLFVTSGEFTVGQGSATLEGGTVVTPGDFTKLGGGLLTVLSDVITNGRTNIRGGTLAINGRLTTEEILVQFGAWLKGSGVINGSVFNSGTVAPGNSPGTMTVNGNFTQNAGGTLEIEVADNAFDQLIVSGRASLAGTLQGIAFGGHKFEYGDQVPFLRAGSISGNFDRIVMPNKFRGRFLVNGNVGSLLVAPESYTLVAENQNQRNVAKALDSFIGKSGDRDAVSLALDLQTEDQYGNAFDQIAPGFYQSLTDMVIEQTSAQNQMLAQRLSAVRLGARGFNVIGLDQAAIKHDVGGKNVLDAKGTKDVISPATETNWSVFVQGNGIFARTMNVSQIPNYRFNSGGFLVGADYKFGTDAGSKLIAGIYTGYQGTYSCYANGSRTTINSALFGGYASFSTGGFYSDLIVGGSYNGYRASRSIDFSTIDRTARSSPDGGSFTTYLDAGYDWKVGGFTFGPLVSAQYTYAGTSGFTESGADSLDLKVSQQNANSIRTNIGGRIAFTWQVTDTITIVPEGRMFWQHEYLNGPRDINASLNGGSGPGFEYTTIAPGRDSVFAGAGVSANFGDRWSTYFYYNANFGREDFVSHMISGGLNFKF